MTAPAVVRRRAEHPQPPAGEAAARRSGSPAPAEPRPRSTATQARRGREAAAAATRRFVAEQSRTVGRGTPLGAVLLSAVAVHAGLAPHLAVRGAAPDVLLVAVAAVALASGQRTGAAFGFAAGLGADLFLATPLGTSALAYTLVGHTLGRLSRPPSPRVASTLCRPGSTCFACRAGRRHEAQPAPGPALAHAATQSGRRRAQRVAARRAAHRRSVVITFGAVAAGRVGATVVATSLGGVAFPEPAAVLRIVGIAALSAPFGPLTAAAVRRVARTAEGRSATARSANA